MQLNSFTPAETLMLLSPLGVSGKDLIKYSLLDLAFRGILRIYQEWGFVHPRDPYERLRTFITTGRNYSTKLLLPHQTPFFAPFDDPKDVYLLRTFLREVYQENGRAAGFKSKGVYKSLQQKGYFSTSLGLKKLNIYFINNNGLALQKKFAATMKKAEHQFPICVKTDVEQARNLLNELGTNVLLLECFDDHVQELLQLLQLPDARALEESSGVDIIDLFELSTDFIEVFDCFDSLNDLESSLDIGSIDVGSWDFGGDSSEDFGGDW